MTLTHPIILTALETLTAMPHNPGQHLYFKSIRFAHLSLQDVISLLELLQINPAERMH